MSLLTIELVAVEVVVLAVGKLPEVKDAGAISNGTSIEF